jgi:hypothetical protein
LFEEARDFAELTCLTQTILERPAHPLVGRVDTKKALVDLDRPLVLFGETVGELGGPPEKAELLVPVLPVSGGRGVHVGELQAVARKREHRLHLPERLGVAGIHRDACSG